MSGLSVGLGSPVWQPPVNRGAIGPLGLSDTLTTYSETSSPLKLISKRKAGAIASPTHYDAVGKRAAIGCRRAPTTTIPVLSENLLHVNRVCRLLIASTCAAGLLSACTVQPKIYPLQENFGSTQTYSRLFDATPAQTCEASRRALLSQGYIVSTSRPDLVEGQKSFQPDSDSNLQMSIRVVCTPESRDGNISLGFVTALQDTYALKKSNNSASLGVGAIGSVSLPFSSSNDSLVRVASETISSATFYERFFDLVSRYLSVEKPPHE